MNIRDLANQCINHAWRDECDDTSRRLLEEAWLALSSLRHRTVRLAQMLERREACRPQPPALPGWTQIDVHGGQDDG